MYRAALADKSRPEFPENIADADQNLPEAMRILAVVRRMAPIQSKSHRSRHFDRHCPHLHVDAQRMKRAQHLLIEPRHGARLQLESSGFAATGNDLQRVR